MGFQHFMAVNLTLEEMPWTSAKPNSYQRVDDHRGYSWEEQAFAEDAGGVMGGSSTWPPRSYACTFCRKEFRSAQALGGHMNIHRRDRARLRQGIDININPEKNFAAFDHIHPPCEMIAPEPRYLYPDTGPHASHLYHSNTGFSPDNSIVRLPHNPQAIPSGPIASQHIATFIPSIPRPASSFSPYPATSSTILSISPFNKTPYMPPTNLFSSESQTPQAPFDTVSNFCLDSTGSAEANTWNTQTKRKFLKATNMTTEAAESNSSETKEYANVLDLMKDNGYSKSESVDNIDDLDLELRLGAKPPAEKYRIGKLKRGA